ncbi:MAG: proline dehydrogenase family protein [Syntrophobacteraceae bacterium]|nr:proline dehydrogenase family protein [Syntrophobacteraceae bacterium]
MPDIESRIRGRGYRLYELMEGEDGSIFGRDYWAGKLFDWCMHNEAFKVQMFRFIDVFPSLVDSNAVISHLQQYFSDPELNFPSALNWGIKYVAPSWMTSRIIARAIGRNIRKTAAQFIAGTSPEGALPALVELRSSGFAFSLDLLGEAVVSEREAEEYQERYLRLLDFLDGVQGKLPALGHGSGKVLEFASGTGRSMDWGCAPRLNVSIKASAMYSQMSSCAFEHSIEKARERLRPVLRRAVKAGAFVHFDMEHHAIKDLTLALYRSLLEEDEFRGYPHTGIVIQAYLRESESDLREMIRWAENGDFRLTIRLVKGAYWDQEVIGAKQKNWPVPVFTDKAETDANFERLAAIILEKRDRIKLACASHNIRSIAAVAERAKELSASEEGVEFQVLRGMGRPVRNALLKAGLRVRVYCPVGEMLQGMSYLVRRLLENTANQSFLRQAFSRGISRAELLRNPAERLAGANGRREKEVEGSGTTPRVSAGGREPTGGPPGGHGDPGRRSQRPFTNEPVFDWSRRENREGFGDALQKARASFPIRTPLQIDGKKFQTSLRFESSNPDRKEEIVGIISSAGMEEAEAAVAAAGRAFPAWRDTPAEKRAEYLFEAAERARRRRFELAAVQVLEVGKSWSESDADVCEAIDYLEYYGREMLRFASPRVMGSTPGETSRLLYEPRGVAVVIAPWNFPLAISTGMSSAAIVAGNTVVYKPASLSAVTGYMLNSLFEEAGLPPGVFNFLPGSGGAIGEVLTTHPDVAMIAFTGSREVGTDIIAKAHQVTAESSCVKNVVLEMGGKNAIIIDSDADLDEAVVYVLQSAFGYQGQKCSACSRLIVSEKIYDRFLERLEAAAASIDIGPVEFPENFMGAVIDEAAQKKISRYIEMGKKAGYPVYERKIPADNGFFVPLCIFKEVDPLDPLAQEEIFGPVLSVVKVGDFDEALRVANGTRYALTGGLFSRSPANIGKACESFRTGNLYINRGCTGAIVGRHPFGGFKMSGLGSKAGGPDYLLHFMVARNIVENTVRRGFAPFEENPGV